MKSADILNAIANETRLDIVRYIHVNGEATVNEIREYCQLKQSATSQNLAILRRSGILKVRRDRQLRYYSIACDLAIGIINMIDEYELSQKK